MSLEAISCPYTVLDQLFDGQGGDYRRFTTVAASYFHKLLQEGARSAEDSAVASGSTNVERVPILNRRSIQTGDVRPNTLVRFIGMVGDVFEPELYAPAVEVQGSLGGKTSRKSCAFRDSLPNEPESHFVQELEQR